MPEAATMLMIAQAGINLYQSARGGGSGMSNLLRAQVRMLQAMNAKLDVINATVVKLYSAVEEIRDDVEMLPHRTALETFRQLAGARAMRIRQILRDCDDYSARLGVDAALVRVQVGALDVLNDIQDDINLLWQARSPYFVPVLATCWYAELGLLLHGLRFDPEIVRRTAIRYSEMFSDMLSNLVIPELNRLNTVIEQEHVAITLAAAHQTTRCRTGIASSRRVRTSSSGGGGPQGGGRETRSHYTTRIVWTDLGLQTAEYSDAATLEVARLQCQQAVNEGAPLSPDFGSVTPVRWVLEAASERADIEHPVDDPRPPKRVALTLNQLQAGACSDGRQRNWFDEFVARENQRGDLVRNTLARLALFGGLFLIIKQVENSCQGVLREVGD